MPHFPGHGALVHGHTQHDRGGPSLPALGPADASCTHPPPQCLSGGTRCRELLSQRRRGGVATLVLHVRPQCAVAVLRCGGECRYTSDRSCQRCCGIVDISSIFVQFFILTFDWMGNYKFWLFHWKNVVQIHQRLHYLNLKMFFLSIQFFFYYFRSTAIL